MDAEDLLLREFLGIRTPEQTASPARWIRSCQREDGTWANFYGGPPELSTTVEAYVALRLAGDEPGDAAHMKRAAGVHPGLRRRRAHPGLHPDLAGAVRPVVLGRAPGAAARADVPAALRPAQHLRLRLLGPPDRRRPHGRERPPAVPPARLRHRRAAKRTAPRRRRRRSAPGRAASRRSTVSSSSTSAGRSSSSAGPPCGGRSAGSCSARRRTAPGAASSRPGCTRSSPCDLQGYALDHPCMRAGLEGLDGFTIEDDAGQAARGLPVPGLGHRARGHRPRRRRLAAERPGAAHRRPATCSPRRSPSAATGPCGARASQPGGWAFEFANDNYPDIDDTAEVVLALERTDEAADGADRPRRRLDRGDAVPRRGLGGLRRRQHPDAVPGAAVLRLRGADRPPERGRDGPRRRDAGQARARRSRRSSGAWSGCSRAQEDDGSWFGRWGANYVYGTGAVVPALVAAGLAAGPPGRAPGGRLARRPPEPRRRLGRGPALVPGRLSLAGRGPSTASQTAWALLALLAAGERSEATERGVALPRRDPGRSRLVGRAVVHRHRLSRATSTSTTTCTGSSSRSRPWGVT